MCTLACTDLHRRTHTPCRKNDVPGENSKEDMKLITENFLNVQTFVKGFLQSLNFVILLNKITIDGAILFPTTVHTSFFLRRARNDSSTTGKELLRAFFYFSKGL